MPHLCLRSLWEVLLIFLLLQNNDSKRVMEEDKPITLKDFMNEISSDSEQQHCIHFYITYFGPDETLPLQKRLRLLSEQLPEDNMAQYWISLKTGAEPAHLNIIRNKERNYLSGSLRKHAANCAIAFLLGSGPVVQVQKFNSIMKNFLEDNNSILNVERDLFVFLSRSKQVSRGLLLSDFGVNIKKKMSVVAEHETAIITSWLVVCHYCSNGSPKVIEVPQGLSHVLSRLSSASDFHGKTFRIAAPRIAPRIELKESSAQPGKYIAVRGVYKAVFDQLTTKLNLTYEFFPSTGGGTGLRLPNGTWIGAVGDIVNGRADFGIVSTTTFERRKLIDLAFPVEYESLTFTLERQKRFFTWIAILWSFTPLMWLLILLCMAGSTAFLWLLPKISKEKSTLNWEAHRAISYIFGSLLDQGMPGPYLQPLRVFATFWLFFALIISTIYRSKLLALLCFPLVEPLPGTFKELSLSNYDYGLQYLGGAAFNLLNSSKNGIYQQISERMSIEKNPVVCIKKAKISKFGCIGYRGFADWIVTQHMSDRHGRSTMVISSSSSFFIPVGIIMRKRATYLQELNAFIYPAVESGLVRQWFTQDFAFVRRRRWLAQKEKQLNLPTAEPEEEPVKPLMVIHLYGALVLILTGLSVALVSFLTEYLPTFFLHLGKRQTLL